MDNLTAPYGKLLDSGFDFLTLTTTPKQENYQQFHGVALDYFSYMESHGQTIEEVRQGGYEGWKSNGTFYGQRGDSRIWQTSGEQSRNVAQFARQAELTPNVTRADLQQTVSVEGQEILRLERMCRAIRGNIGGAKGAKARKSSAFYETNLVTGFTFGDRSSARYSRTYRADIRHPERYDAPAVRFECEFKAVRANQIWEFYERSVDDSVLALSVVGSEFLRNGIREPMRAEFTQVDLPPVARCQSKEKTVKWLISFVAPILKKLVAQGYASELRPVFLDALTPAPEIQRTSATLEAAISEQEKEGKNHG